jgi:nucleotide-binding universal stress UspA family protein
LIASQVNAESNTGVELDFVERVIMGSGRPVLLVPYALDFAGCGRRALIAWNGTRESARAAFDAVPLLKSAESVTISWVDPQKALDTPGSLPGAELANALARHGIKATAEGFPTAGLTAGEALKTRLADLGADLLVMGAYGHTRVREFVFGGATRFILETMPVPVLMSH